ncbi:hypothetical protein [Ferruginibacter sp. HRS2-29]|uniref:hypothetical protein n=1 Tax=Ferruginibacter sp. HRS2-29 TaxID=2487334 RepID=UPI0020CE441F|nr:hypothetical protein [Ferruginibacter sp. HRS2-29]MCP9752681.1 hypothetical protein [Ferruginibacter sp. HRS2-29]
MLRVILLIVFFANSFCLSAQHSVKFKVHYSELYATYDFLTKISSGYPDNDLKTIFEKSLYNTAGALKMIEDFSQIRIDYSYPFAQYPSPLKVGFMSRDFIEKNLAISQSIEEFKEKSAGIIPNEDLVAFSKTIEIFTSIYRELVFEPNKASFTQQQNSLQEYVDNNKFADFFDKGIAFYDVLWDPTIPFDICLLPSYEKGNLGARAFINVAICEPPVNLKDFTSFFSVAMHEIYHILYDNQSLSLKKDITKWFRDTHSPNSQYALLLLNEVLATGLGNGYLMEKINGKIDEEDWYANKYITGMAKETYALLKKYVEEEKPIDEAFVKTYVKTYDTKFGDWNKELAHLFMYRYIISDNRDDIAYFRKNYRFYSNNRTGSPVSQQEIDRAKEMPVTKVLVISSRHKEVYAIAKNSFDELKNSTPDLTKEFIRVFTLKDNTKLFIINRHLSSVEALMNKYFPGKIIK